MTTEQLQTILQFMKVTEEMKRVYRTVDIVGNERKESDAEHSWHLAMLFMLIEQHLPEQLDRLRVFQLLIMHDVVEVYAGDTPLLDTEGRKDKVEREVQAAEKLFSQLDEPNQTHFRALFEEFEENKSMEARVAKAIDKIHPLIQNLHSNGTDFKACGSTFSSEMALIEPHVSWNDVLQSLATHTLEEAKTLGFIS